MPEVEVIVHRVGNSIDLRVSRRDARRLGLVEGRRLRVRIDEAPAFEEMVGSPKGRVQPAELHSATNEDEDLE